MRRGLPGITRDYRRASVVADEHEDSSSTSTNPSVSVRQASKGCIPIPPCLHKLLQTPAASWFPDGVGLELKLGVKERRDCFEPPRRTGVISKQPGELGPGGRVCRFHDFDVLRHRVAVSRELMDWRSYAYGHPFCREGAHPKLMPSSENAA